jgi:hypothetical protein
MIRVTLASGGGGVAMAAPVSVAELLEGHVGLAVECLDRIYLNAYVPTLQVGGQVVTFLTHHLGQPIPSPAVFARIGNRFRAQVARFAGAQQVPLLHFGRHDRKIDQVRPLLAAAEQAGRPGVVAIGVTQEFQNVFTATKRRTTTGPPQFCFRKEDRRVTCYYFYVWDDDFGPGFIKLCSYFPYPGKVWVNGHEWAKRQAAKAGIGFTALSNGFATCDDPDALQQLCDRLGPADIRGFFERWLRVIPTPLGAADQRAGYWWELSMRQVEVSRTLVFDAPRRARGFFEQVVRDNLGLGRPEEVELTFTGRRVRRGRPRIHHLRPSAPGWSPAACRSPSTSSTSTPVSSSTSKTVGRCGSRPWSTPPTTLVWAAASATLASWSPRPVPPTGVSCRSNVPARAVPSGPPPLSGSNSPTQGRANEPERFASGTIASWPWPAPCA